MRLRRPVLSARLVAVTLAHALFVVLAYVGAYLVRFEFELPPQELEIFRQGLLPLVAIRLFFFARDHVLSGSWQYVGLRDVSLILKSTTSGTVAFVVLVLVTGMVTGFPRSVVLLEWLFTVQLVTGSRVLSRALRSFLHRRGIREPRNVVIIGSGPIAENVLRELSLHPSEKVVIGRLDEPDADLAGPLVRQLPRLGSSKDLASVVRTSQVNEVFVAFSTDRPQEVREIVRDCRRSNVPFRLIASLQDVLDRPQQSHDLDLDELFDPAGPAPDPAKTRALFQQKTVLVMGAAGRIGSALAEAIARAGPRELLLLDRNESPLYYLEVSFLQRFQNLPLTPIIADALDLDRLDQIFRTYRPQVVIHAAAYTGPDLFEDNVDEVRRNNFLGAWNVLRTSRRFDVERTLILSLDESRHDGFTCVHRAVESCVRQSAGEHSGAVISVRFPTVLGSAGCPVTAVAKSLPSSEPLEISHPEARVRVLSLANLIPHLLDALAVGRDGEVLAIDTGRDERVLDVAETLRRVCNLQDLPIHSVPPLPDHVHPVERVERTPVPGVLRRAEPPEEPPCVVEILRRWKPGKRARVMPLPVTQRRLS